MRLRSLSLVAGLLMLVVLLPADSAAAAEIVKDGGFESTPAADDNPNWSEGWIALAPICDVETCGDGSGTAGPHAGKNWAWLGGSFAPEQQFVAQEVTIPAGTATLTFYLWLGASSGNGQDAFRVYVDNTKIFEVFEDDTGYAAYKQVTVDVSQYVGTHDLSFEFAGFGGPPTNFSLDDVSLQVGALDPKTVTLKGPKSVAAGKKAKLTATVAPCAGHEGDDVEFYRGKKQVATVASDNTCTAKFKAKINKTTKFMAVSPKQDTDHAAGTSKKLKIRAK